MIKKRGRKYVVLSEKTGRSFGTYDTKAEAEKRLRQVEFFKQGGKARRRPRLRLRRADRRGAEPRRRLRRHHDVGAQLAVYEPRQPLRVARAEDEVAAAPGARRDSRRVGTHRARLGLRCRRAAHARA